MSGRGMELSAKDSFLSEEVESNESSGSEDSSASDSDGDARRGGKLDPSIFNWQNYSTLLRIRLAYGVGTLFATIVSVTLGAALQLFFSAIDAQAHGNSSTGFKGFVVIVMTPVALLFIAALADEMLDLFIDALDTPPLTRLRAMLLLSGMSGELMDRVLVLLVEVLPPILVLFVLASGRQEFSLTAVAALYVEGTQVMCFLLSLVQLAVHTVTIVKKRAKRAEELADRMDIYHTLVGETGELDLSKTGTTLERVHARNMKMLRHHREDEEGLSSALHPHNAAVYCLVFVACLLGLWLGTKCNLIGYAAALVSMIVVLTLLSRIATYIVPGLLGWTFNFLVGLFIFIALGLSLFSASGVMEVESRQAEVPSLFEPPVPSMAYTPVSGDKSKYPICYMQWGDPAKDDHDRLSVLDMAVFANAVYFNHEADLMSDVKNATLGTHLEGVELEHLEDPEVLGRWGVFTLRQSRTRVFAIRGTTSKQDTMADADMYAAVQVMQFFDTFLPLLSIHPASTTRKVLGLAAVHRWIGDKALWKPSVLAAMHWKRKSVNEGFDFMITGHSLGGALAVIAGAFATQHIGESQVVVFSPPGQDYSSLRFGIPTLEYIQKSTTVIQPNNDLVPMVDKQVGFTQHIECEADSVQCHSILRTSCELFRSCGDPRGRTMEETCRLYG